MAWLSRFNLRLQSLVLLVLVPGLLVATAFFGWSVYRGVYDIIMRGFDEKLYAVSTVTGAFIRGEDHDALFAPRSVSALAPTAEGDGLFGVDAVSGELLRIDLEQGGALPVGARPADPRAVALLAAAPDGLAHDARSGLLYAGGPALTAIDAGTGTAHALVVDGLPAPVRAPALDPRSGTLYALAGEAEALYAVDLAAGTARAVGRLHAAGTAGAEGSATGVTALAFVPGVGLFAAGADRLMAVDTETAAVDSASFAVGYRSESHPAYQRYVGPMRRIMEKKGITYLYTETVEMGGRLNYGIDATEGENHSLVGTGEEIADDEIPAMERAMLAGQVRLSDLEVWDAWGLLKTSDAPIFRENGEVAALAAADVDISVILQKTREVLIKVGIVAAITVVLGGLVSLFISRRLVSPLTEVKDGALRLAAGQYDHRIADQQLLELRELGESFNSMSDALAHTLDELTRTNRALEAVRRRQALEVVLADPAWQADPGPPFQVGRAQPEHDGAPDPSGFVHVPGPGGGRVLVWLAEPLPDAPLENLRLRREMAALARPLLAQRPDDWDTAAALLAGLFPRVHCLALMDAPGRTVRSHARVPTRMAVVAADGLIREVDLSATPHFTPGPADLVVLAARDPLAAADAIRRARPALPPLPQLAVALHGLDIALRPDEVAALPAPTPVREVLAR